MDSRGQSSNDMENAYNMKRRPYWFIAFFLLVFLVPLAKAQGNFTAASRNQSGVNSAPTLNLSEAK